MTKKQRENKAFIEKIGSIQIGGSKGSGGGGCNHGSGCALCGGKDHHVELGIRVVPNEKPEAKRSDESSLSA